MIDTETERERQTETRQRETETDRQRQRDRKRETDPSRLEPTFRLCIRNSVRRTRFGLLSYEHDHLIHPV